MLLVSGNNLSACVGTAIGARILGKKSGSLLGAAGFTLGLVVQGSSMMVSSQKLLPNSTTLLSLEALAATILVFLVANLIRAPLSLTMALVGVLTGVSVRNHMAIDSSYFSTIVLMWFLAPVVSAFAAIYIIKAIVRTPPANIWRRVKIYKILIMTFSILTSYVLGANTLGLIVALEGFNVLTILISILAIFIGSLYFSSGEIKRVGRDLYQMKYSNALVTLMTSTILVEFATILGIPLSNTQTLSAAVFGAGMSSRKKFMSLKPFLIVVIGWIVAPILSFIIGFII